VAGSAIAPARAAIDGSMGTDCGLGEDEAATRAAIEGSMGALAAGGEASALIASRSVGRTGGIGALASALASALVSARTLDVLGAEPSGPPPGIMALPAIASLMLGTLLRDPLAE
jgi:hypothetical protein